MTTPESTRSLAQRIQQYIHSSGMTEGVQLPSERELAERFETSRGSVREALRELEANGVVYTLPRIGTYVSDAAHHNGRLFSTADPVAIAQIFEMRMLLEPGCAALAAVRANASERAALQASLDRMRDCISVQDVNGAILADADFHQIITAATRNPYLMRLTQDAMDALEQSRGLSLSVPGQSQRALAGHQTIYNAIAHRDAAWAHAAMMTHLKDARHFIELGTKADG